MSIVEGKELMLYFNNAGTVEVPVWVAGAAATSHKISKKNDLKERVTKDTVGLSPEKRVTKKTVTITVDALVSVDSSFGYDEIDALDELNEPVLLKYGFKGTVTGRKYKQGLFIISNLDQDAPAEGDATFSCTFESCGNIETKTTV